MQKMYALHSNRFRIRFTREMVRDIKNPTDRDKEMINEHNRAHRNSEENKLQVLQKFYFPQMRAKILRVVKQCRTCKLNKYDRHPNKHAIQTTPTPKHPGHIVHVDIYHTNKQLILIVIDKFSKYAQVKLIRSKAIEDIREPLREIIFSFGVPKTIVIDNEKSLNSASIQFMVEDQLGIEIFKTPPYASTVNGQVERFHSTLSEIMRCLKTEQTHRSFQELLDRSTYEYNYTIHSTTGKRPIETFFGRRVSIDPEQYENARRENIDILRKRQAKDLETHNKTRQPIKTYSPGDIIYVRINKRLGSKLTARYRKEIVKEDKSSVIITEKERTLNRIKPKRFKKSINTIGKVWKWIAGNPDHDDLVTLESQINNIIDNNNNQVTINKIVFDRINKITAVSNKILKAVQSSEDIQHNVAVELKYKLRVIKEEIINIDYAIHWAKAGIVNSYILSNEELELVKSVILRNNLALYNVEESLELANIKIASNSTMLFYIVGIPLTNEEICESILIKPIKRKKYINKIPFEDIVTCNDKKIFAIKQKTLVTLPVIRAQSKLTAKKIALEGSYAVQFHNSTVIIDNQKYSFNEILTSKEEEILSLEMMKELHINNTKRLDALKTTHTAALVTNFSLTIMSIIFIAGLIIKLITKINFKAEPELSSYNVNANEADTQKVTTPEMAFSTEPTSPVF
ncbi:uncharacterized protein LOC118757450 [Rhagoletis pomonella]|uniref:uncharacterized protein LOC118757450 n=1 Tax=Rhagoletis pomonella TaxID=28610 RepID=UPI001780E445|nr:uncharacterized protein LOC118757450 [Rhagoletis pomonella]